MQISGHLVSAVFIVIIIITNIITNIIIIITTTDIVIVMTYIQLQRMIDSRTPMPTSWPSWLPKQIRELKV